MRNWAGTMAVFLTLSLLIEFATLAGDLAKNNLSWLVFLQYWIWNLPPFLSLVLPLAFLFSGVITFSDASVTHEWVALRAGGVSLTKWLAAGAWTWSGILVFTFVVQAFVAPLSIAKADHYYARILNRPVHSDKDVKPWLYLSRTGVLWHLEDGMRWGFPLLAPKKAPVIVRWKTGQASVQYLDWGSLEFTDGPPAETFFPDRTLLAYDKPERVSTMDLFRWQHWAPEADRETLLWTRLLAWLSGPFLLFAAIVFAFPPPRHGRGQALGLSLVVGLVFTGAQMIFGDAARTGELPPIWGLSLPLLLCAGFGMIQLPRLRT
jgi:lipopolysaccharide export LptBFGC system permease protein LptF